jgi:hypothetical protein
VLSSESWRSDASFIGLSTGIDYFDDNNEIWLGLFSFFFFLFFAFFSTHDGVHLFGVGGRIFEYPAI